LAASDLRPRPAGLLRDISTVAGRALRAIPREAENILPSIFIAMFFFLGHHRHARRADEPDPQV
jgi:ABC-2 type transport system permease protein